MCICIHHLDSINWESESVSFIIGTSHLFLCTVSKLNIIHIALTQSAHYIHNATISIIARLYWPASNQFVGAAVLITYIHLSLLHLFTLGQQSAQDNIDPTMGIKWLLRREYWIRVEINFKRLEPIYPSGVKSFFILGNLKIHIFKNDK